ncbi:MAG: guanylate kinase [Waddliaceae bacterium]|nr:guanylate kinase [Waddliaceae bacterium]MBT3579223.1 guanylate kinase [Waddliaceae bacterium]MBT4444277.1 guanylate kinase [Waddliaceae bacterium]MBT6928922.1 guanylate kinase [Waddliaceae bacterium]MBT7264169.1 guanylate kinase [Waddliaceae bacterium]
MAYKLLGNKDRGAAFVVSGPAGTGKNTLVDRLIAEFPCVVESVSCTTRDPRPNEVPGEHYNFLSKADFEEKILHGEFLEYAEVFGNYYGTLASTVEKKRDEGKHVFLVIDVQGAMNLRKGFVATFIFIAPPSLEELRRRLTERDTEPQEKIEQRLSMADGEMSKIPEYDYVVVNDDVDIAYDTLKSIVIAEEHKV